MYSKRRKSENKSKPKRSSSSRKKQTTSSSSRGHRIIKISPSLFANSSSDEENDDMREDNDYRQPENQQQQQQNKSSSRKVSLPSSGPPPPPSLPIPKHPIEVPLTLESAVNEKDTNFSPLPPIHGNNTQNNTKKKKKALSIPPSPSPTRKTTSQKQGKEETKESEEPRREEQKQYADDDDEVFELNTDDNNNEETTLPKITSMDFKKFVRENKKKITKQNTKFNEDIANQTATSAPSSSSFGFLKKLANTDTLTSNAFQNENEFNQNRKRVKFDKDYEDGDGNYDRVGDDDDDDDDDDDLSDEYYSSDDYDEYGDGDDDDDIYSDEELDYDDDYSNLMNDQSRKRQRVVGSDMDSMSGSPPQSSLYNALPHNTHKRSKHRSLFYNNNGGGVEEPEEPLPPLPEEELDENGKRKGMFSRIKSFFGFGNGGGNDDNGFAYDDPISPPPSHSTFAGEEVMGNNMNEIRQRMQAVREQSVRKFRLFRKLERLSKQYPDCFTEQEKRSINMESSIYQLVEMEAKADEIVRSSGSISGYRDGLHFFIYMMEAISNMIPGKPIHLENFFEATHNTGQFDDHLWAIHDEYGSVGPREPISALAWAVGQSAVRYHLAKELMPKIEAMLSPDQVKRLADGYERLYGNKNSSSINNTKPQQQQSRPPSNAAATRPSFNFSQAGSQVVAAAAAAAPPKKDFGFASVISEDDQRGMAPRMRHMEQKQEEEKKRRRYEEETKRDDYSYRPLPGERAASTIPTYSEQMQIINARKQAQDEQRREFEKQRMQRAEDAKVAQLLNNPGAAGNNNNEMKFNLRGAMSSAAAAATPPPSFDVISSNDPLPDITFDDFDDDDDGVNDKIMIPGVSRNSKKNNRRYKSKNASKYNIRLR